MSETPWVDELHQIYARLDQQDVEQFYAGYLQWHTGQQIAAVQAQINALQQQIAENAERMQQVHPSPIALSTLARLQASGVSDIHLLDRLLERGESWLDNTMQHLEYCERFDFIDGNYTQWCEHALEGAYDWIDSIRDGGAAREFVEPSETGEVLTEATEELLLQKLSHEEEPADEEVTLKIPRTAPSTPEEPITPVEELSAGSEPAPGDAETLVIAATEMASAEHPLADSSMVPPTTEEEVSTPEESIDTPTTTSAAEITEAPTTLPAEPDSADTEVTPVSAPAGDAGVQDETPEPQLAGQDAYPPEATSATPSAEDALAADGSSSDEGLTAPAEVIPLPGENELAGESQAASETPEADLQQADGYDVELKEIGHDVEPLPASALVEVVFTSVDHTQQNTIVTDEDSAILADNEGDALADTLIMETVHPGSSLAAAEEESPANGADAVTGERALHEYAERHLALDEIAHDAAPAGNSAYLTFEEPTLEQTAAFLAPEEPSPHEVMHAPAAEPALQEYLELASPSSARNLVEQVTQPIEALPSGAQPLIEQGNAPAEEATASDTQPPIEPDMQLAGESPADVPSPEQPDAAPAIKAPASVPSLAEQPAPASPLSPADIQREAIEVEASVAEVSPDLAESLPAIGGAFYNGEDDAGNTANVLTEESALEEKKSAEQAQTIADLKLTESEPDIQKEHAALPRNEASPTQQEVLAGAVENRGQETSPPRRRNFLQRLFARIFGA